MLILRLISNGELACLKKGETISNDTDWSRYYLNTNSKGVCGFPVTSTDDDDVEVINSRKHYFISVDKLIYGDNYNHRVWIELPDSLVTITHGSYELPSGIVTVKECSFKEYSLKDVVYVD